MDNFRSLDELEGRPQKQSLVGTSDADEPKTTKLQVLGIISFGIFVFFFFLLMKLPEARIQNFLIAHIRILAQQQGFLFSAEKIRIGMILGPSIIVQNAELKSIDNEKNLLKIPYFRVRPSLFSLFSATKKASISAELLNGEIAGVVGGSPTEIISNLSIEKVDLNGATLLRKFIPLEISGVINGKIKLDLNMSEPNKSDGLIDLTVEKLNAPAQAFMGFNLPKIAVQKSKIEIDINQGHIVARNFEIGKDTKTDDIVAKISGDGALDKNINYSKINAKISFQLSQSVIQSFPLLDALLGQGKTSDGKYAYRISGPIMGLEAVPGG